MKTTGINAIQKKYEVYLTQAQCTLFRESEERSDDEEPSR